MKSVIIVFEEYDNFLSVWFHFFDKLLFDESKTFNTCKDKLNFSILDAFQTQDTFFDCTGM